MKPSCASWICHSASAHSEFSIDPANDGAEAVNGVADRVRAELLRNIGLADLLKPAAVVSARTT